MDRASEDLPLDQRFRLAEGFALDLGEKEPAASEAVAVRVCIGNCNICPYCARSDNRDKD